MVRGVQEDVLMSSARSGTNNSYSGGSVLQEQTRALCAASSR